MWGPCLHITHTIEQLAQELLWYLSKQRARMGAFAPRSHLASNGHRACHQRTALQCTLASLAVKLHGRVAGTWRDYQQSNRRCPDIPRARLSYVAGVMAATCTTRTSPNCASSVAMLSCLGKVPPANKSSSKSFCRACVPAPGQTTKIGRAADGSAILGRLLSGAGCGTGGTCRFVLGTAVGAAKLFLAAQSLACGPDAVLQCQQQVGYDAKALRPHPLRQSMIDHCSSFAHAAGLRMEAVRCKINLKCGENTCENTRDTYTSILVVF